MNRTEHLLACLSEELSEVQQEVSKCLRFTPNHKPDEYDSTNLERVRLEFADVFAIAWLLMDEGVDVGLSTHFTRYTEIVERMHIKRLKTLRLMEVSKNLGAMDETCLQKD